MILRKHKKRSRIAEAFYWLRYRVGEYSLRGFVAVFPWIPLRLLSAFASWGERLTFAILWRYRIRMEENLSMAMAAEFPTSAERKALVRKAWRNFAQGFLTLESDTEVNYHVSEFYFPQSGRGIRYDDPTFGIRWPAPVEVISDTDRHWPDFRL